LRTPRKPKLFNVVRIDGRFHVIYQWDSHFGYGTEPLADMLARNLLVDEEHTLWDALIDAGWSPPA